MTISLEIGLYLTKCETAKLLVNINLFIHFQYLLDYVHLPRHDS